jgi:hypothetical protein
MENEIRISYAIEHVMDNSVFIVDWKDWEQLVYKNGEPTKFSDIPLPISGLMSMASNVMTAGSGTNNLDPGIDVVREDAADYPDVINIDHYTVFEHFNNSLMYEDVLRVAMVVETEELDEFIGTHVFVVGPYKDDDHHLKEIPERIKNAKLNNREKISCKV